MLLGGLIGTATGNKSGLMSVEDKKRLGRRFFKGYTKLVESKYWYNHYVALIFGASPASNLGSLIAIDWKGNELISVTRFFGNNDNVKLYLGSNPETNMYELWLGLIGLDGDGSEFIIQSRESIDLDSKTVETLPSYLKVIPISWQKNNDFSELGGLLPIASENNNGLMSAYYSQSITRMNGYSEGTSMSLAKLPIGFSYLNVVDSSDFPSKSGAVLKFKFGGTMYLQGWFMNGFYVRCIRDGVDTGWKKIATS